MGNINVADRETFTLFFLPNQYDVVLKIAKHMIFCPRHKLAINCSKRFW